MKKLTTLLLALIFSLTLSLGAKAEFFTDIIVTSPNGIWTDSRAYSTLNDAISTVGANERTITIVSPQTVNTLTVPSNVTLKFERNGSITNSGQLTINTTNIIAPNRQIFTGIGNIDFAPGTVVKSGWFPNFESALALTVNDTVTLKVTKSQTLTASFAVGNNVTLSWDSPGNILTANAGVTVSNIGQVNAGSFQLFAGAGNYRFRDGTNLNSSWFNNLRSIITWVSTNRVNLTIQGTLLVDLDDTIPANIHVDMDSQRGLLNINPGIILTINSAFSPGPHQCFTGTGTVVLPNVAYHYPEWYSSGAYTQAVVETALAAIGTSNKAALLIRSGAWTISSNADWSAYTNVTFQFMAGAVINHGSFTIKTTYPKAGLYQIYNGTGLITRYGDCGSEIPQWWGATGDNSALTEDAPAIQAAINTAQSHPIQGAGAVYLPTGEYDVNTDLSITGYIKFFGDGRSTVLHRTSDGLATDAVIKVSDVSFITLRDFTIITTTGGSNINGIYMRNGRQHLVENIYGRGIANRLLFLEGIIGSTFISVGMDPTDIPGISGTADIPLRGAWLDEDTVSGVSATTTCTFINCKFDMVSSIGVRLIKASVNNFLGCSSQNSPPTYPMTYGVYIDSTACINNVFQNHYFGEGAYGAAQIYDLGNRTLWLNPRGETSNDFLWFSYNGYKSVGFKGSGISEGIVFYDGATGQVYLHGRANASGTFTLNANQTTTVVTNTGITANSRIIITPTTANAAADQGSVTGVYISAKNAGVSFTVAHPNNANVDKVFDYFVFN